MRTVVLVSAAALSLAWLAGCERPPAFPEKSEAPPPAVSPSAGPAAPAGASPAAAPSVAAKPVNVRLSAGGAVPQPGPGRDGTTLSFGVDYEFVQGEPGATEYIWVIDRAYGPPAREPVRLERQGTLSLLMPGWRPEEGPFRSHLEDQQSNRISASVEMR